MPHSSLINENLKSLSAPKAALYFIFLLAITLRLLHNFSIMQIPLYYLPLGGHVAFIETANQIASGDLMPGDRPFIENSPLYSYLLAFDFSIFGQSNLLVARLITILLDSLTAVLITLLAGKFIGRWPALLAGLIYATYGPAIFFSCEIIYTTYTLFFLTLCITLLLSNKNKSGFFAGIFAGLAIASMPSLIIMLPLLMLSAFALKFSNKKRDTIILFLGVLVSILPFTLINYLNSGQMVFLTTSAGHNLYIGHNPDSSVGYYLPDKIGNLDSLNKGSIFDSMKKLAEQSENRKFDDSEISAYYLNKAFKEILNNPRRELALLLGRCSALLNKHEALTYSNYQFTATFSPLLNYLPRFDILIALASLGLILKARWQALPLLIPIIASILTILSFFFISRFRMPMIPFLSIFAAVALSELSKTLLNKDYFVFTKHLLIVAAMFLFSRTELIPESSANEWNKLGIVYKFNKQPALAESAFRKALAEDPSNINAKGNLTALEK